MHIILGGTGQVGGAVARALLARGEPVTIVTRVASKAQHWTAQGARVAVADVRDREALRQVFRTGRRAFLLNPPADPTGDSVREELETAAAIAGALSESGLEKAVVASTYGARPGRGAGDLNVLYELEQSVARQLPTRVMRGAYYMSNWSSALDSARDEGVLHTFYPAEFELPMVAPEDLGQAAARLLLEPASRTGVQHVEGPRRYSPAEVAGAFAAALRRQVSTVTIPRERWQATFEALGFSQQAARSYAAMTALTLDAGPEQPTAPERGPTSLQTYITRLVRQQQ